MPAIARTYLFWTAVSGFTGVALGAFGAHALKERLSEASMRTYQLAVQYQFFHTVALGLVSMLLIQKDTPYFRWSATAFLLGIVIFSGSLYLLAITRMGWLGAITPLGGLSFLCAWALLAYGLVLLTR